MYDSWTTTRTNKKNDWFVNMGPSKSIVWNIQYLCSSSKGWQSFLCSDKCRVDSFLSRSDGSEQWFMSLFLQRSFVYFLAREYFPCSVPTVNDCNSARQQYANLERKNRYIYFGITRRPLVTAFPCSWEPYLKSPWDGAEQEFWRKKTDFHKLVSLIDPSIIVYFVLDWIDF